jgi:hypothetical protein
MDMMAIPIVIGCLSHFENTRDRKSSKLHWEWLYVLTKSMAISPPLLHQLKLIRVKMIKQEVTSVFGHPACISVARRNGCDPGEELWRELGMKCG